MIPTEEEQIDIFGDETSDEDEINPGKKLALLKQQIAADHEQTNSKTQYKLTIELE